MNSALHHITILLLLQLKMATLYKVLCSSLPEAKDETFLKRKFQEFMEWNRAIHNKTWIVSTPGWNTTPNIL